MGYLPNLCCRGHPGIPRAHYSARSGQGRRATTLSIDEGNRKDMSQQIIHEIEQRFHKPEIPEFAVGDTVRVGVKVVEGSRERVQEFEGVVIRRRSGGINENFTVRRIASHGIGVERTFLVHAPRVDRIKIVRRGKVRRAKLYYLRGRTGKAARIKERRY